MSRVFGRCCWLIVWEYVMYSYRRKLLLFWHILVDWIFCLFLAPSGLLVSDVMAIVVEGELRSPRRDLFLCSRWCRVFMRVVDHIGFLR